MAMIRVGIPQALLYYQYFPMWKTFFERLGAEVVVSLPTNKTVLNLGVSRAVADTCLPVKIFLGHVISLIEKCDCIFIPAVTSLGRKIYNCSKIIGLPNMARALIPECPVILAPEINLEKGRYYLYQNIYKLGRSFTSNPFKITVFEIGGQDNKVIIISDGVVIDFGMNSVCVAGTGSFLEHQAERLNIRIENFGSYAMRSKNPARVAGRCTVFVESDMVHKQQMGYPIDDIIYGLCQALVRNYLNNVALGKEIRPRMVFQGGVAFNKGIIRAFNENFHTEVYVPPHNELMGAIGAVMLVHEEVRNNGHRSNFKGSSFICKACPNLCEISQISASGKVLARWGGRCDIWDRVESK